MAKTKKPCQHGQSMHVTKKTRQTNWPSRLILTAIAAVIVLTVGFGVAKFLDEKPETISGVMQSGPVASQTLQGVYNFRTVSVPDKMKAGVLWRSARLAAATPDDVAYLAKLLRGGIVIDLRTATERELYPDQSIPNVPNQSFPISGAASANSYVAAFVNNDVDRTTLGQVLVVMANTKGSVLAHCTYGKDRTGWLVAVIMYAMGASDSQVMTEYLRSNGQIKGASVSESWLTTTINAVRQKYSSINGYIRNGLGVSDSTLTRLKAKFAV